MSEIENTKKYKFVLSIGDEGAILTLVDGKTLVQRVFAAAPSSTDFTELLNSYPTVPISAFIDVVDQSYTHHPLPPVSQLNIKKLVNRKLEKDYDADDLKTAIPLNRDKTGRKDWNYLFISLRNVPPFADWVDAITPLENPFSGIYLLPIESTNFLKDLRKAYAKFLPNKSNWQILVSHNRVGGFRQMVYRDGNILFTRIAQPIGGLTPDVVAGNIEQETLNTIEYIRRLGFEDSSGLDIFILASKDVKRAIDIRATSINPPVIFTPYEAAQILGIPSAAQEKDRFGDVLLATHFAATKKHILKLETSISHQISTILKANFSVKIATSAIIIGILSYSGLNILESFELKDEIENNNKNKQIAETRLDKAKKYFLNFEEDSNKVKQISSLDHNLSKNALLAIKTISKFGQLKGYNITTKSVDVTMTEHKDKPNTSKSTFILEMKPSFEVTKNIAVSLLDEFADFESDIIKQFSEYDVSFNNSPAENLEYINITDNEAANLTFSLTVYLEGPYKKKTEEHGKKRARNKR